ncbi:SDR family NAD(P)-dependent oxidoreductase [Streptomyces sp. NPDC060064]|uniref:SDR family NAD(P)-dependent oxidoreductase n=1 Tax=Streptomyces sp. NPDC060064 TaxID=3347049 RepID=UPI0036C95230
MMDSERHEATPRRTALVTGANKGLGKEISRQLAALGMSVLLTARNDELGRAAAAELAAEGGDIRFARLDVTEEKSVRSVAELVDEFFGRLDILVNNAGVSGVVRGERLPLDEISVETLRSTLETNFVGAFALTQALLPALRTAGGRVVNVTSALATFARTTGSGPAGRADLIPYCASKVALNMTSVLLADQLRESGVTVCSVSPGYVATDMNNFAGTKTVRDGARTVVRFATAAPDELPDRAFITEEGVAPW